MQLIEVASGIKTYNMKMLNSIIISIWLLSGCKPDPIILPPVNPKPPCVIDYLCDSSKIEIVWRQPLSTDTAEWASTEPPIIFENNVLFTRFTFNEQIDTLKQLNRFTGKLEWTWADYQGKIPYVADQRIYFSNNKYIFTTWNDVYAINASDGKLSWKTLMPVGGSGDPFMNIANNKLYHTHNKKENRKKVASYIVRSDIDFGKWDTVFTQPIIGNLEPDTKPPAVWIAPSGDEILIFQIRYVDFSPLIVQRVDVVAFNVTKKENYFRFDNIDPYFTGSVGVPFILNNKVYMPLNRSVVCIDMIKKQKVWEKEFGLGGHFLNGSSFLFVENKFFVKPNNESLYQLDPDTGLEIWVDKNGGGAGPSDMVYNEGIIYYTGDGTAKIYALDIAAKKYIWAEKSPNYFYNKFNGKKRYDNANIGFGGIAIDPVNRLLYTSDNYFAMCLKLPKK